MPWTPGQRVVVWVGVGLLGLDAWWMAGRWMGDVATLAVTDLVGVAAPLLAAAVCFGRSRREAGRVASSWQLIGLGAMAWGLGEALWAFDELVIQSGVPVAERSVPFPSFSDAGYLAFPLLAAAGLLVLPSRLWARGARARVLLDGLLIALALLALSWPFVLSDLVAQLSGPSQTAGLLGFAYAASDAMLIALAILAGAYGARHERSTQTYLVGALAILGVTDSAFWVLDVNGLYQSGGPLDLGWPAGFLLLAFAAAGGRVQTADLRLPGDPLPNVIHLFPILPLATTLAMAAGLAAGRGLDVVGLGVVAIVALLAAAREAAWQVERRHWAMPQPMPAP